MTLLNEKINPFIKLLKLIYYGMVLTDPCKKCILRPCCSEVCQEKYTYGDTFSGMGVVYIRSLSWMAAIDVIIIFPWALFTIIFK